jgi:hypothetical protein
MCRGECGEIMVVRRRVAAEHTGSQSRRSQLLILGLLTVETKYSVRFFSVLIQLPDICKDQFGTHAAN